MSGPILSRRMVLEYPMVSPDGAGGFTENWAALGTLWAELRPRGGREANAPSGGVSKARFKVTVRGAPEGHSNRPIPGQRLIMGARRFRIDAVTEDEPRGMYLACDVTEELAI